jgi:cytochrome P450
VTRVAAAPEVVTDLAEPIMFSDPFPRYAQLRREAPVSIARSRQLVSSRAYLVSRYDDVLQVHTDPRFSSDIIKHGGGGRLLKYAPRVFRLLTDSMVFKDDPEHKRLRGLVNQAFTPRRVQQMSDGIERIVDDLIEGLAQRDTVDLIGDFAIPLPLSVISEMLGICDADRDKFHEWTTAFTESTGSSPIATLRALPTANRMMKMFGRLAAERRAAPDDGLISALVRTGKEDDRLADNEVVAMIFLLLLAGHDTTANLIGSSILALLDHPEQMARLRENPDLIGTAVEELLRFTTPVPCGAARIALEDVEVGDVIIPKGSSVLGMIISANRDEAVFDRGEELDLGREPNRHISFAFGAHYCLGSQLARLEGRIAIGALVQRFPGMRLVVPRDELRYKSTQSLRGLRELPLRLR